MLQGEYSAIFLTFIKLPFFIKIFVLAFLSVHFTQVLLSANNKGEDLHVRPHSLISIFVGQIV